MKKLLLGVVAIIFSVAVNGQITSGAKGGLVFSKLASFEADGSGLIDNVAATIEGRYSLGLNDIAKGGNIDLSLNDELTNPSFKNSYFYFGLGYKL